RFRRRIVINVLKIDLRIMNPRPSRLGHGLPALERFETPGQKPLWLALLGRDEAHGRFIKPLRSFDALDAGLKTVFVLVDIDLLDLIDRLLNSSHFLRLSFNNPAAVRGNAKFSLRCERRCSGNRFPCRDERADIVFRRRWSDADADRAFSNVTRDAHRLEQMTAADFTR